MQWASRLGISLAEAVRRCVAGRLVREALDVGRSSRDRDIFIDTSALYALLVRTEAGHRETAAAVDDLLDLGRPLVSSNYVLVETTALLQHRFGLAAVRDLETRIVSLLMVRWIDGALHRRAVDRLIRSDRRPLSLVDCSSFTLMDAAGIAEALALDRAFESEGYRVLPA